MSDRPETTCDIVERLERMSHHDGLGHREACAEAAVEIKRLRRAVAYARVRLKQPGYMERLDKIVSGEMDREYEQADFTPLSRGRHGAR